MLRRICLRSFCHHYYGRLFTDHSLMSYQKVWNNDSGDLSTLLPFSIIWVNCNPPFCLWISIFFSTSLFFFFSNQFYTLWKVPPRFAERIVCIPCILCQILASSSNETVLCSKQFTNQKERPEKMKLNQTLTPTVRVSCPGPGSICLTGV